MKVNGDDELAFLFEWNKGLKSDDLPPKGGGYVQYDETQPRMFKTQHILPGHIDEAAVHIANHRPELDAIGKQVAGEAYATRYDRMLDAFNKAQEGDGGDAPAATATAVVPFQATSPAVPQGSPKGGPQTDVQQELANLAARLKAAGHLDAIPGVGAGSLNAPRPQVAAQPVPRILLRALAVFDQAGVERMHSKTLAAALGLGSEAELSRLLNPLEVHSLKEAFQVGGTRARGYARADVQAAADRVAAGEITVPAEIAEWPAAS
jgi:hypothetical protein